MKMNTVCGQLKPVVFVLIFNWCFNPSHQLTELKVCELCNGTVLNGTAVGQFCFTSAGRIDGRCCWRNGNTSDPERLIGLDLSNCSLTRVEDLLGASTALMMPASHENLKISALLHSGDGVWASPQNDLSDDKIDINILRDLSLNPIINISDTAFQGFIELNHMILPQNVLCPGGNTSWEKVKVREGNRVCEGQKNTCNQTGQLSINCPENSLCGPYGPGFYECSCADNYHGYKCLREGEFPAIKVFGSLGASTVVISLLLWVTQRRKVKSS